MELRAQSTPRSASTTSTASVASRKAPKAEDLAATAANEARQLREEKELLRRLRQADARPRALRRFRCTRGPSDLRYRLWPWRMKAAR